MSDVQISPLAKRLAEENSIDWRKIRGTGPEGRVIERDILTYLARIMSGEADLPAEPDKSEPTAPASMPAAMPANVANFAAASAGLAKEGVDLSALIGGMPIPASSPPPPAVSSSLESLPPLDFGTLSPPPSVVEPMPPVAPTPVVAAMPPAPSLNSSVVEPVFEIDLGDADDLVFDNPEPEPVAPSVATLFPAVVESSPPQPAVWEMPISPSPISPPSQTSVQSTPEPEFSSLPEPVLPTIPVWSPEVVAAPPSVVAAPPSVVAAPEPVFALPEPVKPVEAAPMWVAPEPAPVEPAPAPIWTMPEPEPVFLPSQPTTAFVAPQPEPIAPPVAPPPVPEVMTFAPAPELTMLPPAPEPVTFIPEPVTFTPAPEPMTFTPAPEVVAPAPIPEPTILPPVPEPTILPPVPEPAILPPVPEAISQPISAPEPVAAPVSVPSYVAPHSAVVSDFFQLFAARSQFDPKPLENMRSQLKTSLNNREVGNELFLARAAARALHLLGMEKLSLARLEASGLQAYTVNGLQHSFLEAVQGVSRATPNSSAEGLLVVDASSLGVDDLVLPSAGGVLALGRNGKLTLSGNLPPLQSTEFLQKVAELLENPVSLLI